MATGSILGTRVLRVEDPALLRGDATYVDNIGPDDALHVTFVRSILAGADLGPIDTSDAAAMPGVVAVVTAADLADVDPVMPHPFLAQAHSFPLLATDAVRYVGQPVVAVVTETRAQGEDAIETIWPDYEPRPVVVDIEAAATDEILVRPDAGTNIVFADGEIDEAALADCEVVVRARIENPRMAAVPLEVRAAAAQWDGDHLTQWSSNQGTHGVKTELQRRFGLADDQIRVITPDVGGGFGAKHGVTPEELLVPYLAKRLGRPVRFLETRSENMVNMVHGRGQVQHAVLGGTRDGRLQVYRLDVLQDAGAHAGMGGVLPFMTRLMAPGVYDIADVGCRIRSVVTNTSQVGAFRGAGRPEAAAAIERMVDLFAHEIGMDPAEVRRRNVWPPDAFPLSTATGAAYDCGDYEVVLDKALAAAGYDDLRAEQRRRIDAGETTLLGIGLSVYVEITNVLGDGEYGAVEITADGGAIVRTGSSAHGQGHHTAWAMLVSDRTGIPVERIEVRHGDTDEVPRGSGTGGSKSLQIGGSAAVGAADLVIDDARRLAADLLEAHPDDIVHDPANGTFAVAGTPASAKTWADLAGAAADRGAPLLAEHDYKPPQSTFPFGAHVSVVDVDVETGKVTPVRHIACDDAGTIVNPLIVDGQVHGGIAAGIGQALIEAIRFDDDGNPQTSNLADYGFPAASEFPSFERVEHETPTFVNPLGAKGIGESGTIGATPAVQNAVVDALSHLGVTHIDMPLTPERVWAAIADA